MKFGNKKIATLGIFIGLGFAVFGGMVDFVYAGEASGTRGGNSNNSYVPLAPLPGATQDCVKDEKGKTSCTTDIQTYVPGIFNLAIGIAGVLAVIMIIIGGVEYMTTDAIGGKEEGKERINDALWGLLLVLVSWILLYTINPKLTIFDLRVGPVDTTKGARTNIINPTIKPTNPLQVDNSGSYAPPTNYSPNSPNPDLYIPKTNYSPKETNPDLYTPPTNYSPNSINPDLYTPPANYNIEKNGF